MQLDTNQVRLRAHRQEVEDRLSNLKNSLARLENEQQRNSVTLADRRGVLSDKEEVLKKFEDAVMHSEAGLQEQQRKIREQEEKKRTKLLQLQAEEAEKTRSQVQLSTLLQVEENLTGYPDGARNLLVAARQGKVKGIFQVLSQSMLVPSEYEVAVSAALGEFLDLVLIEESDPELILAFLETSSKDRVALLPMNWVKGHHSGIPAADQGCIGLASDLIQSESKFDQVIRVLLGNVLVVRDRDAALRIRIGLPENMTVVTLKGELFRADGLIMAGAAGRRGTIGRKRQKAELETKITQINKIIEEQSLDISNLETQIAGIRKVELSINTQLKAHLAKLDIGRKDFQTAQLACEQVESQVTWQIGQRVELEKQISRSLDELNHLDDNLTHIAEQLISSKEVERQINSRLALVSIDEHQIQVTHWETAFAVSKRGLQEAHKRIDERRKILEANQQRCLLLQTRLEATESFYEMMISEKQNYRELEKELTNHIRSLQEQIDPVAIDLSGTELKLEALQAVDTAAQQALNQAERYHAQAQIDFTRQREAVDSLRRRIEDDIGLVVLDYDTNVSGPNPLPFEGMVEQLPVVMEILPSIDESIARQRAQLRRMGAVNMEAQEEYNSVNERYKFLTTQVADLRKADSSLREVIAELDELMKRDFTKTFNEVASEFRHMFTRLFGGGTGRLVLFDEDNPQESGIDIEARLPGRREQGLSLLSGGERSLTAAALIFALLKVSPTPFCVMDEVDAMLDEANVGRFVGLLRELSNETQFIIITHNRNTVQAADIIYGVTMAQDSTSQLISLKLDEIKEEMIR
jgi:chromosome segregation protein